MIEIRVDESDLLALDRALEHGIRQGASDSARWAVDHGKNLAQDEIMLHRRIWTGEVFDGFRHSIERTEDGYLANLWNESNHAGVVNYGRRPGARRPPVQNLMDWVVAHMAPREFDPKIVEHWLPELQALAGVYGPGYVRAAFDLQEKIHEDGFTGIHFKRTVENSLRQYGPVVTKQKTEARVIEELGRAGLLE